MTGCFSLLAQLRATRARTKQKTESHHNLIDRHCWVAHFYVWEGQRWDLLRALLAGGHPADVQPGGSVLEPAVLLTHKTAQNSTAEKRKDEDTKVD